MRDIDIPDSAVSRPECSVFMLKYRNGKVQVEQFTMANEAVCALREKRSNILTLLTWGHEHIGMGPFLSEFVVFDFEESLR
jgi:hypothetical protein